MTEKVSRRGIFGALLGLGAATRVDATPAPQPEPLPRFQVGDRLCAEDLNRIVDAINEDYARIARAPMKVLLKPR